MKGLAILALLCAFAGNSRAAEPRPPCWPKQLGSTGSDFKAGATADGRWIGWTCVVGGVPKLYGVMAAYDYAIVHPNTAGLTPIRTARAYWDANVLGHDSPAIQRLRTAMRKEFQ